MNGDNLESSNRDHTKIIVTYSVLLALTCYIFVRGIFTVLNVHRQFKQTDRVMFLTSISLAASVFFQIV